MLIETKTMQATIPQSSLIYASLYETDAQEVGKKLAQLTSPSWASMSTSGASPYAIRNEILRLLSTSTITIARPVPKKVVKKVKAPVKATVAVAKKVKTPTKTAAKVTKRASPVPAAPKRPAAVKAKRPRTPKTTPKKTPVKRARPASVREAAIPVPVVTTDAIDASPLRGRPTTTHNGTVHAVLAGRVHSAYSAVLDAPAALTGGERDALAGLADAVEGSFGVDFSHLTLENRLRQTLLDLGAPAMMDEPMSPVSDVRAPPDTVTSSFRKVCSSGRSARRPAPAQPARDGLCLVHAAVSDAVQFMAALDMAAAAERAVATRAMGFVAEWG